MSKRLPQLHKGIQQHERKEKKRPITDKDKISCNSLENEKVTIL